MKSLLSVFAFLFSVNAMATIDSIGKVVYPYMAIHAEQGYDYLAENWDEQYSTTQMFCMGESMYWDSYSSSALPKYEFLVKPVEIPIWPEPQQPGADKTAQMNALADPRIKIITDWDMFDNYVELSADSGSYIFNSIHEPEFVVDVSGYDQSTAAGRLEAITMAKLAVIMLHFNLGRYGSLFRLNVEIKGLPDQEEFRKPGFNVIPAQTAWPYSGPSPLAQLFYKELISEEFCSRDLEAAEAMAQ